jgi:hypothetical protein
MTPEAQRIAIAEVCPRIKLVGEYWHWSPDGTGWFVCIHNDPLKDLNAMHEAEKALGLKYDQWTRELRAVCERGRRCVESAIAAHRAEAFRRTLGLWRDDE